MEKGSTYSGQVTYNGKAIKDIFISCIASYIPQLDRHYPQLTVYETCMFAYECMNTRNKGLAYAGVEVSVQVCLLFFAIETPKLVQIFKQRRKLTTSVEFVHA